ncbi:hypothetical protein MMC11_003420 [Xylographa trunciseda]|nr:hypothetical protein [Xylographa trunciseda]
MHKPKPILVFVHGAFGGPEIFDAVAALLRKDGYVCNQDISLPGTGGWPLIGLEEDAAALRATVLTVLDGGDDCVVVMHSYGGVVGAQGLAGLGKREREGKPGVLKMVFVTANIPKLGEAHLEQLMRFATLKGVEVPHVLDVKDGVVTFVGPDDVFFNDFPTETRIALMGALKAQSAKTFMTPLTAAAYETIPGWYLVCTQDNVMTAEFQEYIASVPGEMMEVVERIDSGHFGIMSQPEKVADFVRRAASSAER